MNYLKTRIYKFRAQIIIFIIIIFLTITQSILAEDHLLILGGGGFPKGDKTSLDNDLNSFGAKLVNSKWKYDISFNGGHKNTDALIQNNYSKSESPATDFTPENFTKLIESYKLKIENNEIKSGDQLMIFIYSHGGQRESKQRSHSIAAKGNPVSDLNTLAGSTTVDLDRLQEIIKLTNKKGIKLGLVDLSCHSGATLALKDNAPNTCIIAATGPEHLGFVGPNTFTNNFLNGLKPGLSLEEVFLNARSATHYSEYPMISTNESQQIVKDLYKDITPYLYYYEPGGDKMTPYISDNASMAQICKREDSYNKLIAKIDNLKSVLNSKHNSFNADILKDLLQEYKRSQDKVLQTAAKISSYKLDKVETFSIPPDSKSLLSNNKTSYTWSELLNFEVDYYILIYEKSIEVAKTVEDKRDYQLTVNFLKTISLRKQQILKENPQLLTYKSRTAELVKQMKDSRVKANQIAAQEKILYDELYRRGQNSNPSDPCKTMTF